VSTSGLVDTKQQPGLTKRRQYSEALKRQMVAETQAPGALVSIVARRHDVNSNQLFRWRRQLLPADRAALARLNRTVCEPDAIACDMHLHHPSSTASIVVRPLCPLVARFESRVGMWRGGGRPGMSEPSVPHKDDRSTPLRYPKPR
jgi:transposase-like protein